MQPTLYVDSMDVFLNLWFTSYDAARAARERDGGYLFPHAKQFFVTTSQGVREMGFDPEDTDWERIGWDWVKPADQQAWERLDARRLITRRA